MLLEFNQDPLLTEAFNSLELMFPRIAKEPALREKIFNYSVGLLFSIEAGRWIIENRWRKEPLPLYWRRENTFFEIDRTLLTLRTWEALHQEQSLRQGGFSGPLDPAALEGKILKLLRPKATEKLRTFLIEWTDDEILLLNQLRTRLSKEDLSWLERSDEAVIREALLVFLAFVEVQFDGGIFGVFDSPAFCSIGQNIWEEISGWKALEVIQLIDDPLLTGTLQSLAELLDQKATPAWSTTVINAAIAFCRELTEKRFELSGGRPRSEWPPLVVRVKDCWFPLDEINLTERFFELALAERAQMGEDEASLSEPPLESALYYVSLPRPGTRELLSFQMSVLAPEFLDIMKRLMGVLGLSSAESVIREALLSLDLLIDFLASGGRVGVIGDEGIVSVGEDYWALLSDGELPV